MVAKHDSAIRTRTAKPSRPDRDCGSASLHQAVRRRWSLSDEPPVYGPGDCPVAERMGELELQIKASLHEDTPKLMEQIADAFRKVADHADEL